ncbi:MAG: flippase-like domain-containing protein, partial [Thermoplasmatales archaeon]
RNYAWQLIQKEQKIKLGFLQSLKIFLIGYFYASITPGYIGQLMRVPYMKEKTGEPYGKLFVNSILETVIHTLSLYGMMVVGALLIVGTTPELFTITTAWIVILAVVLFYFIKKERGENLFFILIKYLVPKKLKYNFNKFVGTFYADFPKIRKLIAPLIIGLFTWIIIFSQEYIFVLALGVDIPYLYFLLLFPIANTAGFIPITFAGLGTREATAIFLFSTIGLFNVGKEEIFVVSIVGFIITDLCTGFIGFILSLTEARMRNNLPNSIT